MKHTLAFAFVAAWLGGRPSLAAADDHQETKVFGTLTTEAVPCSSLCTESTWGGTLDGTSSFTLISMEDTATPDENISQFHGNLVLSTPHGDLIGTDLGLWNLDTGAYVDVYTVTSGTGDYTGATAIIRLSGTLNPVTGLGLSRYDGVVTRARGEPCHGR